MTLTAEQLEQRKHGIGASEIGAIAGLNPWQAPIDVWLEKTGKADKGPQTSAMSLGHLMEPVIAGLYAEETGAKLRECATQECKAEPWMLATPDRIALFSGTSRLLECKNVGSRVAGHWSADQIPDYVYAQVQWQEHVTGFDEADVAAIIGGQGPVDIRPCNYVPDIAESLIEIGREFWFEHVQKDIPPEVDASDGWKRYVASRWPKDLRPIEDAPKEAGLWAAKLAAARVAIKDAEDIKDEAETALKALIGDAAGFKAKDWSATWKLAKAGGTDWKKLATELGATPEQIEQFKREGARRFLFKETAK